MSKGLRLEFDNLPLVEAVVRASFNEAVPLTFTAIYEAREKLASKFGHISEAQRYEAAPGISETIEFVPGAITGFVLDENKNGLAATIQSRLVAVRWIRSVVKNAPPYPRFSVLRDTLWEVIDVFREVSGVRSLPIAVVNMSYANFIDVPDSADILARYFSKIAQVKATDDAERINKLEFAWRNEGIDLRFRLQHVNAKVGEETKSGFQLTTVAGGAVGTSQDDPKNKLVTVHERLQYLFRDLLSDQAKKEWGLREVVDV